MPPRAFSRFTFSEAIQLEDGTLFLTDDEPFRYVDRADSAEHVVVEGDTLWSLAGRYFEGFPRPAGLYWIIADFQPDPIVDPTIKLIPGTVLIIPSPITVDEVFAEARRADLLGEGA